MSTEIQQKHAAADALADEIKDKHAQCGEIQSATMEHIAATIDARVAVARLVETAAATIGSGVGFAKWWRDRDMPVGWAAKYLKLAKTADRHTLGDKGQLRLVGLLPEPEGGNEGNQRERNPFEWTKWAGKIKARLTIESIGTMGRMDREVAMKQLEPLVAVYEALKAGPSTPT